jgi:LuxR family maltose regulon positive regulatory protein
MQMAGKVLHMISFTSYLADILLAQGRLRRAERTYLRYLEIVREKSEPEPQETAVLHLGLSETYYEQGDLDAARRHLLRSEALGEHATIPPWYRHWILVHTRMKMAQANVDGVVEMLTGAEQLYYKHPIPDIRPLSALLARAWLAQGRLNEALGWVRERGLHIDDDLSYLREFEHITLARILIAQYRLGGAAESIREATRLLDRLLLAAEEGGRMGSAIEILVLQAIAHEAQGDMTIALRPLAQALSLAEPEGYVRVLVDEGQPMARLLTRIADEGGGMKPYVHRLLAALGQQGEVPIPVPDQDKTSSISAQPLLEPLSERELEVLQLIARGMTNREIAARLYLSLNTVKVHNRNIYGKLGAHNRTQAVAKAREFGILSSS